MKKILDESLIYEILSVVEERIVAVRYQKQIALAFHPELDNDLRIHEMFLSLCN